MGIFLSLTTVFRGRAEHDHFSGKRTSSIKMKQAGVYLVYARFI